MTNIEKVLAVIGDTEETGKTYQEIMHETALTSKQLSACLANKNSRGLFDVNISLKRVWKGSGIHKGSPKKYSLPKGVENAKTAEEIVGGETADIKRFRDAMSKRHKSGFQKGLCYQNGRYWIGNEGIWEPPVFAKKAGTKTQCNALSEDDFVSIAVCSGVAKCFANVARFTSEDIKGIPADKRNECKKQLDAMIRLF